MATLIHQQLFKNLWFNPRCEPKPKTPTGPVDSGYHSALKAASHVSLGVISDPSTPARIPLTVTDGSTGKQVSLVLNHSDTVQRLREMFKEARPNLGDNFHLILNGKPVEAQQTMAELGVKPGSLFITYQKCVGG
ncbi:hypothetical protein NFI96_020533 [Prochilodus magdalenae]|nr:hypothetical protein NFI96_020533 [Prochilodus magdalenae]